MDSWRSEIKQLDKKEYTEFHLRLKELTTESMSLINFEIIFAKSSAINDNIVDLLFKLAGMQDGFITT